jgi:hypothetical protein
LVFHRIEEIDNARSWLAGYGLLLAFLVITRFYSAMYAGALGVILLVRLGRRHGALLGLTCGARHRPPPWCMWSCCW